MTAEYKKDFLINLFFIASILALAVVIAKYTLAYFFPFVTGLTVALAVQRPAKALSCKIHIRKQICAVVLTVLICILTLAAVAFGLWVLGGKLASLIGKIPKYFAALQNSLNTVKSNLSADFKVTEFENIFSGAYNSVVSGVTDLLSNTAATLIGGLPGFLIGSVVTVVASCYIAKDFDRLKKFAFGIIPEERAKRITAVKNIVTENALKFIKGYGIIAAITFLELSAALALLGVNKPVLRALMISLVDALPVLGIGTVMIPWATAELLRQNLYLGFGLLAVYAVIVIIRNFIEPKIIGGQIGINPVFTLVSMFLGLKVAGITGLIFFPLSLTVMVEYYRRDMQNRAGEAAV